MATDRQTLVSTIFVLDYVRKDVKRIMLITANIAINISHAVECDIRTRKKKNWRKYGKKRGMIDGSY